MARNRKRTRARQHELEFRNRWGGARRGAGRKPNGPKAGVSHDRRPTLEARHPNHVTVRLEKGLPSLRHDLERRVLERHFARGADRFGFRLTQYSIQSNHVHFIAESTDRRALWRGMQGLQVRMARALNKLWRRRGSVFADRYHARALRTPREVRNALVYVLQNAKRHGIHLGLVDPWSSGPWFDGWTRELAEAVRDFPGVLARTWLLRFGWRLHGLIDPSEAPRPAPA